jgi:hypothetical protein
VPLAQTLSQFQAEVAQCESLIANAHKLDPAGQSLFPQIDRRQITVAAFLNLFIAWETFLENALADLMTGEQTLNGTAPVKYVSPLTPIAAKSMVSGGNKYFSYSSHEKLRKIVSLYFHNGYPFEPHIGSIYGDLSDINTMRNSSAHKVSTTQLSLEGLAGRIFGQPKPGIDLYTLLTSLDPRQNPPQSVFSVYKDKLLFASQLIVQG